MTNTIPISLYFEDGCAVSFEFSDAPALELSTAHSPSVDFDVGTIIEVTTPPYTGDYTATPSTSQQVFQTDGLKMTDDFTVDAMPTGSASTPATSITATPTISVDSSGLITSSVSASQSITPTIQAGYVDAGQSGTVSVSGTNTKQLSALAATTYQPQASDRTIAAGTYLTGAQTIKGAPLQSVSKSYTPTESQQTETVTNDSGYYGLSSVDVTVDAIPSNYVGSGVVQRGSSDLSASGGTVITPAGYYASQASKSVSSMTLPSAASSSSSGASKATISASTVTRYLNIPTGYNASASYYTISAMPSGSVSASASVGQVSNHSVSVTPSATANAGYVENYTVNGQPVTIYAGDLVSGDLEITTNGDNIDVSEYETVSVNVAGHEPELQAKSVTYTPTLQQQSDTVTYDTGYDGLSSVSVTINAIPYADGDNLEYGVSTQPIVGTARVGATVLGA